MSPQAACFVSCYYKSHTGIPGSSSHPHWAPIIRTRDAFLLWFGIFFSLTSFPFHLGVSLMEILVTMTLYPPKLSLALTCYTCLGFSPLDPLVPDLSSFSPAFPQELQPACSPLSHLSTPACSSTVLRPLLEFTGTPPSWYTLWLSLPSRTHILSLQLGPSTEQ